MSDSTRTIHWYESRFDLEQIKNNGWQYQIAKLVSTDKGKPPISNVVWKSLALQPRATISWVVQYALNWTVTLPTDGISVTVGGEWQVCDKGQSFDLDSTGEWNPSASPGQPGWLSVGNVGYSYPGVTGVHIVVGVKNGDNFDCVFVDPTALPLNSTGSYQPQEQVKWWLEASNLQGSVYSQTRGAIGGVDLSSPAPSTNNYEYWTTYLVKLGTWANSQTAPPPSYMAARSVFGADFKTVEVKPWPQTIVATFGKAVATAMQNTTSVGLAANLDKNGWSVSFKWVGTSGTTLSGRFTKKNTEAGTVEALGAHVDDTSAEDAFNIALNACVADLPAGETWAFASG
ncbi:hypothetical protein PspLS_06968 [Pyricularia sp. CBS 133598]|nr:hypothetical protein PspLS_06968 [Pyricularia sp. CBS 133598]